MNYMRKIFLNQLKSNTSPIKLLNNSNLKYCYKKYHFINCNNIYNNRNLIFYGNNNNLYQSFSNYRSKQYGESKTYMYGL